MSSTSFILSSIPAPLPPSSTLNLLPFSLGPSANPYKSDSSALSSYFVPRPTSSGSSTSSNNLTAAFRGRALVGQQVEVPRGYQGVVLRTTARPDLGGVEERRATGSVGAPLTPASTVTSVGESAESGGSTRQTRQRGLGQVALSKPKTRQTRRTVVKKRMRLDSDEEDENEDDTSAAGECQADEIAEVKQEQPTTPRKGLTRTLSKRQKGNKDVPAITVQEPTPQKNQLRREPTDVSIGQEEVEELGAVSAVLDLHDSTQLAAKGEATEREEKGSDSEERMKMEDIVPSPATENDPPSFAVSKQSTFRGNLPIDDQGASPSIALKTDPTHTDEVKDESSASDGETNEGAVRLLRPAASFTSITLWTPDAPLPGFRADELASKQPTGSEDNKEQVHSSNAGTAPQPQDGDVVDHERVEVAKEPQQEEQGAELKKGWWRVGGAGEGGDEFVRAMGEWLGLVETINEPVYLHGLEEDEDEDD